MKIRNRTPPEQQALSVFLVGASQDVSYIRDLEEHLSPLKREGLISLRSERGILAGSVYAEAIETCLNEARIVLLLISAHFIASDDSYQFMLSVLQKMEEGYIHAVPVLLSAVDWNGLPVSKLPALPSNGHFVTTWYDRDEAYADIARGIRKIVYALNHTLDERNITQDYLSYLDWLIKRTAFLDTRGVSPPQRLLQLKLEEVYISLSARSEDFQMEQSSPSLQVLREESSANIALIQPLSQVFACYDHLVILGEPGSGKTILLHYLALSHAKALQDQKDMEMGEARFPIFLRIADYVKYGLSQGQSLSNYLADDYIRQGCSSPQLADMLRAELQAGRCLVLLDGLDAVVHTDDRRMVVQRIEDFVRCYDEVPNRFVLTSRGAGYHDVPLSASFAIHTLQGLEETDMRRFLESWYMAVKGAVSLDVETASMQLQDARRKASSLLTAIQAVPGVRKLASNPLLLRMLVQLYQPGTSLPQRRVALYKKVTDTLVQTWRAAQGVPASTLTELSPLFEYTSITRLLSRLAYWLHSQLSGGPVHEREICRELGKEWTRLRNQQWYEEDPTVGQQIRQFLYTVRDHTGILVEDVPHFYRFAHLSFEEYYAARYLIADSKEQAKRIRAHLHDRCWQEPILLALGFVGMESPEQAYSLVETTILAQGKEANTAGFAPTPYELLLGQDYLFALCCLGDEVSIRPSLIDQLVKRLFRELIQQAGSGRFQKYQGALRERLRSIEVSSNASFLLPYLTKNLKGSDRGLRLWAVFSLGRISRASRLPEVHQALLEMLHDEDPGTCSAALWGLSHVQGPEITALLLRFLGNDVDPLIRRDAVKYLGERGQAALQITNALLDVLHQTAGSGDILLHMAAVKSLGQLGDAAPEVVTALIALLRQKDILLFSDNDILQSLEQLSRSSSEVAPMVANAFQHAAPRVRVAIAEALETFNNVSPDVIAVLRDVPPDYSSHMTVRATFCARQWYWLPEQIERTLLFYLRNPRSWVRWETVKALGALEELSDDADHALLGTLYDKDVQVRVQAVETLSAFEMSEEVLHACLDVLATDTEAPVRARVVQCLGAVERLSEDILQALLRALNDAGNYVRTCAVASLSPLLPIFPEILAPLLSALRNDADFGVRWEVVKCLRNLDEFPQRALSELVQTFLKDEHEMVRLDCARLLGQSDCCDEPMIQALLVGLSDNYMQVRRACSQALVQIGQQYPEWREMIMVQLERSIRTYEHPLSSNFVQDALYDVAYDALWILSNGDSPEP